MTQSSRKVGSILLATVLVPFAAPSAPLAGTQSALEHDSSGWTDLLATAGSDLRGWVRGPIPPTGELNPKSQWLVDLNTGILVCEGNGGHDWIRWDREVADGVFHVEWRFTPVAGKRGYNSGVYARNSADASTWHQAQTGDGSGGYLFGESPKEGKLQRFNQSKELVEQRVKPAGEWNTYELTFRGEDLTLWVNGRETNAWHDCAVSRGYVGLEAEGWRIEFRNVKLKVLP